MAQTDNSYLTDKVMLRARHIPDKDEIKRIIKYSEPIIDQEQDHCFAKLNVSSLLPSSTTIILEVYFFTFWITSWICFSSLWAGMTILII